MANSLIKRAARIIRLAAYDFKSAYAGSVLGIVWAVAEPLVTVAVYWFVYAVAFGGGDVDGVPYYLWLSVGIAPWFFISNGIRSIASSLGDYSYLLKKTVFNPEILPMVRAVSAMFSHMIFMAVVVVLCIAEGISLAALQYLILIFLLAWVFIYSVGRILAPLCVFCKDIRNVLAVVFNIGFWLTPVFWSTENLSRTVGKLVWFNPAAVIVEGYRNALLFGEIIEVEKIGYMVVLCVVLLVVGGMADKRMLPDLSDKL